MSKTKKIMIILAIVAILIAVAVYAYKKWYLPKYGKPAGATKDSAPSMAAQTSRPLSAETASALG